MLVPYLNFGTSSASVIVLANNKFGGCLPLSIANLASTLEELLLIITSLSGCIPPEVGYVYKRRVFYVSFNKLVGHIPYSLAGLVHLEQPDLAHDMLSGIVPAGVFALPSLLNFTFSYNLFCEEDGIRMNLTTKGIYFDEQRNCLSDKALQRSIKECNAAIEHPVYCFGYDYGIATASGGGFSPTASPASLPLPSIP